MDFFSTGGFQRLFQELDSDNICNEFEFDTFDSNLQFHNNEENYFQDIENNAWNTFNISEMPEEILSNNDWLPVMENGLDSWQESETLITQEIEDWEDKFLDNFIEIPELVNILPEKTPLCTDTCDLFLKESAKNLKLNRSDNEDNETSKGYTCTFYSCCKVYAKPAHLKAHLRRHLGEKPYACTWPNCSWKFSRSDELARHRRSHSGIKPYKCNYCAKCFARSDHLTKHRKVHERRLLAASQAGVMPPNVFNVRPGRRKKNSI